MSRMGQPPSRKAPVQTGPGTGVFVGKVTRAAASATATVDVSITTLGGGALPYEDCPFTPLGDLLPGVGDRAWLMIDDYGAGVVVTWRPSP